MRRLALWVAVLLVALGGFYVAWPAWSAHQIRKAIEADDPAALAARIDFPEVRARAKPHFSDEMDKRLEQMKRDSGALRGALAGQLRKSLGDKLVEAAIDSLLTPESIIRMVRQGTDLRRAMRKATAGEQGAGGLGGTAPPASAGSTGAPGAGDVGAVNRRRLGLANIKSYWLTGPLSLLVGLARDPAASEADATVEMAFTGGTWTVVSILPRL